jgi:hypothetical protein
MEAIKKDKNLVYLASSLSTTLTLSTKFELIILPCPLLADVHNEFHFTVFNEAH